MLARDGTRAFDGAASYTLGSARIGEGAEAQSVPISYATADYFPLLGVRPLLGRFFSAAEDRPPVGEQVVVLGYGFWVRQFGGDTMILGRSVRLGERRFQVVGIAPRGFTGAERGPVDVWVPMSARNPGASSGWPLSWNTNAMRVIGRVKSGVTTRNANAQLTAALRAGYTGSEPEMRTATVSVRPLSFNDQGAEPPELGLSRLLTAVALVLLLVAVANVANLLLARAVRRRREIAVRLALGAGRWRLVRLLLVEAIAVSTIGGAVGVVVAYWGGALIRRTLLPDVAWSSTPVDGRVLSLTIAVTLLTGIAVGLIPALRASRTDVVSSLNTASAQAGDSFGGARAALQIVQVALSVVLLFTAGLFVRSLIGVRGLDLGMEPDRVLAVNIAFPRVESRTAETFQSAVVRERGQLREILRVVRQMPDVEGASLAVGTPFYSQFRAELRVPGWDSLPQARRGGPYVNAVTSGYFSTMGTRVLRGRAFTDTDRESSEPVAIVNQTMASLLWPNAEAIGKRMFVGDANVAACARVAGIVADARQSKLREDPAMQYYIPIGQERGISGPMLLVRPRGEPSSLLSPLRAVLKRLALAARYVNVATLQESLDPQIRPWRVGATMFGLFGAVAVVVAAIGLFSVVSYLVVQRTHEIGVRIALGAGRPHVMRLVIGRGLWTAIIGAAIGSGIALLLAPRLQPLLFDNPARDPGLLAMVAAVLLAAAVAASIVPAWRAARVDPIIALRTD